MVNLELGLAYPSLSLKEETKRSQQGSGKLKRKPMFKLFHFLSTHCGPHIGGCSGLLCISVNLISKCV